MSYYPYTDSDFAMFFLPESMRMFSGNGAMTAGMAAAIAVISVVMIVVAIALWVLRVIAYWKLFDKAGQAGWKAIIPVYSDYVMFGIAWKKSVFWVNILISLVYAAAGWAVTGAVTKIAVTSVLAAGSMAAMIAGMLFMLVCSVALAAICIVYNIKLSKAYGYGGGFAVGLIFLNLIFLLILAFDKSRYVKGEPMEAEPVAPEFIDVE